MNIQKPYYNELDKIPNISNIRNIYFQKYGIILNKITPNYYSDFYLSSENIYIFLEKNNFKQYNYSINISLMDEPNTGINYDYYDTIHNNWSSSSNKTLMSGWFESDNIFLIFNFIYIENFKFLGPQSFEILFRHEDKEKAISYIDELAKYKIRKKIERKKNISYIIEDNSGLKTETLDLEYDDIDINNNYNDDFIDIHNTIINEINTKKNGLVLLHGLPGTGKTNYIRYLTSLIDKDVLLLTSNMVHILSSPKFINFMIENKDKVLLIEDGEEILKQRGSVGSDNTSVSNILNVTDGILNDIIQCQMIITFNSDLKNIDEALLRKGRIITEYEFKELDKDKSQRLSDNLGYETIIDKPMVIGDIYNQDKKGFKKTRKRIGF